MTISEIEELFWGLIGRVKGQINDKLTAAQGRLMIWRGKCVLARAAKPVILRYPGTISVVANTREYPLADDFWMWLPRERMTILGKPLEKKTRGWLDNLVPGWTEETASTDAPTIYYEAGMPITDPNKNKRHIGFYKLPGSNWTAKYQYLRRPRKLASPLADGDEYPDLPEDFHDAGCFWAARLFFMRNPEKPGSDPQALVDYFKKAVEDLRQQTREELQEDLLDYQPDAGSPVVEDYWAGYEG